jgi:hypothetical protein
VIVGALGFVLAGSTAPANISTDRHVLVASLARQPLPPGSRPRPVPDIIRHGAPPTFYDVSIATSTSASSLAAGSALQPGTAAAAREKAKLRHYERIMTAPDVAIRPGRLIPAVIESGGRLGEALRKTVRDCASLNVGDVPGAKFSPAAARMYRIYSQQLSMTLQKLEADMVLRDSYDHFMRYEVSTAAARAANMPDFFDMADAFLATI